MSVIEFPGSDTVPSGTVPRNRNIAAEKVAAGCVEQAPRLDQLLVVGVTAEGGLYAASTHIDHADNLLLLERLKRKLMMIFGDDEFAE